MTDNAGHLAAPDLLDLLRACYGGLLLAAPRRVIGVCTTGPASPRAVGVARVLGARQLLQSALTAGALSGSRWRTGRFTEPPGPTPCWRAAWLRSG